MLFNQLWSHSGKHLHGGLAGLPFLAVGAIALVGFAAALATPATDPDAPSNELRQSGSGPPAGASYQSLSRHGTGTSCRVAPADTMRA